MADPVINPTQTSASSATQTQFNDPKVAKFNIPDVVKEKYSDLIPLIIETESMNDQEKSYWFQILPIMTTEQVDRLRNILITEKQQLSKLDEEYKQEMSHINQKNADSWKKFNAPEAKEKIQAIKQAEAENKSEENDKEAQLLDQLNNI